VPAPLVHRLRVRYHECDQQGIVFNANWFAYFDITLTELWRAAFGSYTAMIERGADTVVVDASAQFKAPGRFDDQLEIALALETLGTSSMVAGLAATRDGETLVTGRIVHVFVDPTTLAKQPIPAWAREALAPYVTGSSGSGAR
jgi:acyl-CoA thioester hydrolase